MLPCPNCSARKQAKTDWIGTTEGCDCGQEYQFSLVLTKEVILTEFKAGSPASSNVKQRSNPHFDSERAKDKSDQIAPVLTNIEATVKTPEVLLTPPPKDPAAKGKDGEPESPQHQ